MKGIFAFLEFASFLMWMAFTIMSIALAGLGIEGILLAFFMLMASSMHPVHFPLTMTVLGGVGVFLSIVWRQIGIDHFHYLHYDTPHFIEAEETPASVLHTLIREVEESSLSDRTTARAKAKAWLLTHRSEMDEEAIELARTHFGYLLPPDWGLDVSAV